MRTRCEVDPEIERRVREGDQEAFSALATRYYRVLWRIARRIVQDYHLAQDLTQEALMRAFVKATRIHPEVPFLVWVSRIVRNTAIDVVRRRGGIVPRPLEDPVDERTVERRSEARPPSRREVAKVWREVNGLRESERSVMLLRYARGLELRAIASECGISLESVKSRLHRARRQLTARLLEQRLAEEQRPRPLQRAAVKYGCSR